MAYLRVLILSVLLLAAGPVGGQQTVFPITPGSSVEGNLNNTLFSARFSFEGRARDRVTISMQATSGDLDPFLVLFDPAGDLLEQNDDTGTGSRDAEISIELRESGTYVVEATRFQQEAGTSAGTYRLLVVASGASGGDVGEDPLSRPPVFGVPFTLADYREFLAGSLANKDAKQYFAIGAQQGDLVRVTMTTTGGDIVPQVTILNTDFAPVSREAQAQNQETIVYSTMPTTGWYLIEAEARSGSGSFVIYADRRAVAALEMGQTVSAEFTNEVDTVSYVVNARIGDSVIASVSEMQRGSGLMPEIRLLDLRLNGIAVSESFTNPQTRVRAQIARTQIPRSGPYLLQVANLRPDITGAFELRVSGIPVNVEKLSQEIAVPASYNDLYKGRIDSAAPVTYYRFAGKAGELVTIEMAASDGNLDPYLILMDGQLNELAFNDNVGSSLNARIAQYALPQDGVYYILAAHADLLAGNVTGNYSLALTVGQISLLSGALEVTLRWESDADLNLFVRDPSGRVVSWSNQSVPSGGTLQIDSNTRCQIPSAQPVEHIYWPLTVEPPVGEYQIWVWYQNGCSRSAPVTFSLLLNAAGETRLEVKPNQFTLRPDERFEANFFFTASGVFVTDSGKISVTTPQQEASQGGDILLPYGQTAIGTINDDVFALFYQFNGEAGDEIMIMAEAVTGNLDPIVVLRDDADKNLASNDDADSTTRSARLQYTLPGSGKYTIAVTRFGLRDGTTSGDFRLALQKVNP